MTIKSDKFTGRKSTVLMKTKWLEAFPECAYQHENTCKKLGMIKSNFYRWKLNDRAFFAEYKKIYDDAVVKGMIVPRKRILNVDKKENEELKEKWLLLYSGGEKSPSEVTTIIGITKYIVNTWKRDDPEFEKKYKVLVQKRKKNVGIAVSAKDRGYGYKKANLALIELRKQRQRIWLKAFEKSSFNVKVACDAAGIKRDAYYQWKRLYPEFVEAYKTAIEEKKDFIEDNLMKNISAGDSSCIIFAAKTQLKDRGYIEKQEIEHSGNFGVMLVPGKIEDAHDWAQKATEQQQLLKEKSIETDYIHELEE